MASSVGICNIALASIGAREIRSFDDSNTRARTCQALYEAAKDTLLEQHPWTFAQEAGALRVLDLDAANGLIPYGRPHNCRNPIAVMPMGSMKPSPRNLWTLIGNVIWTSVRNPYMLYTKKDTPEGDFSASFVSALAAHVAAMIAPSIRQSDINVKDLQRAAAYALDSAREQDSMLGSDYVVEDMDANYDTFVSTNQTRKAPRLFEV